MNKISVAIIYFLIALLGSHQVYAARACHEEQTKASVVNASVAIESAVNGGLAENSKGSLTQSIAKSDSDHSEYRYLELPNQLRVLLVSDAKADKAAAALDVFVGSSHDPVERQGLAHFLEHMLFLGTDRYPQPDEYQAFISQHGGQHNAYTSFEHTNYFFDINPDAFDAALDRFSRFFVAPLFNAEYVEREKNAVHSEYKARIKNDFRRQFNVFGQVVNQQHPASKFSVGNLDTLADREGSSVRDDLLTFYKQHYSANRMTLVVLAPASLDELESIVRSRFEPVPNREIEQPVHGQPLFVDGALPKLLSIQPVQELRELSVTIPLPAVYQYYREKPLSYLGNLIGHEGKGSLLSVLKEKGWAESLRAGEGLSDLSGSSFDVTVGLTPAGYSNWQQVLELVFREIELVADQGVHEWRHREQGALADIQFRHKELGDPVHRVSGLANSLHRFPYQDVMRGHYRMDHYDAALIDNMLAQMKRDNALVTLMAPEVQADKVSPLYDVPYAVAELPKMAMAKADTALKLPEANAFVPQSFALNAPDRADEPGLPVLLGDKSSYRLWGYEDSYYQVPKAQFYVAVKTPLIVDAKTAAMADLYVRLVQETLNEVSYEAVLAGLGYSINRRPDGVGFVVSGFDDKLPVLVDSVVGAMLAPVVTDELISRLRDELIRVWRNSRKDTPYKQLLRETGVLLSSQAWQPGVLADALEQFDRQAFDTFIDSLFVNASLEMLASGNVTKAESVSMAESVADRLAGEELAPWVERGVLKIPAGEKITIPMAIDHRDSAVLRYYQGRDDSLEEAAQMMLMRQLVKSEFFHQLRTEQQLGYVVAAVDRMVDRVPGFGFLVQSPSEPVSRLNQAIDQFLVDFGSQIKALGDDEFEQHRQAVLTRLKEKPKSLAEQSSRYWGSIDLRDYDFSRRQQLIDAVSALSLAQLVSSYGSLVLNAGYSLQLDSNDGKAVSMGAENTYYRLPSSNM